MADITLREEEPSDSDRIIIDLCKDIYKKHPDIKTKYYWCHIPYNPDFITPWGKGASGYWADLDTSTNGYLKMADEKIPYPTEEELLGLIGEVSISQQSFGDFEKDKWLYLSKMLLDK